MISNEVRSSTHRQNEPMPVLLHYEPIASQADGFSLPTVACLIAVGALLSNCSASAQVGVEQSEPFFQILWRWLPLLLKGFGFNLIISALAMIIGTIMGVGLGLAQLSSIRFTRGIAWMLTQFFRNSPMLVLLFFVMFLVPFQVRIGNTIVPVPDWTKAIAGFSLSVMANMAEIFRGAVGSVATAQWEASESLAFTPRQTMFMIILPQCIKRMTPPWMNLYSIVTMSSVLASVIGVNELITLTGQVHSAEGSRPALFAPLYGFALLCFFLYCYPIDRWTARLERKFATR
jgi:polar amino acid transport system permease protein